MDTEYIYFSQKILYTWQVVGVGAGYIVNVFNYKLYWEGPPWEGPPGE